jgi:DNA mismatch repair protein MutS
VREGLRTDLRGVYDIERLVGRIASGRASPRDLRNLSLTLERIAPIRKHLEESRSEPLAQIAARLASVPEVEHTLHRALVDDPASAVGQGPIFREDFDATLDELTRLAGGGRDAIVALEESERKKTGITSLKVRHTRVFGFYLEVTKTHLAKVPDTWKRKQTVANAERFVTDDLARLEEQVATAELRRSERELELMKELVHEVANAARPLSALAGALADVDALLSFAETSAHFRYVRPTLNAADERSLSVVGGRHPIVESALKERGEAFIPSDLVLNADDRQLVLVTGPNMAGKSTLMRQVALIQVLAQAGCFVPATRADLSLCDRVFTRVGASDDLAEGRSTFMVEMSETAHILRHATKHSLVLLDEIGRGTSTFDGLSIAWAVGEHIHDAVGARTLFATHYHELCDLAGALPRAKNIHVVVKEWNDRIIFTRTIADGGAERSYGIQVARLAGLPPGVLVRAREILAELEGDALHPKDDDTRPRPRAHRRTKKGPDDQMSLFMGGVEPAETNPFEKLIAELAHVDANRTTPIDALNLLDTYVREARRLLKPVDKGE